MDETWDTDPYETDVYAWSQRQAALLRDIASRSTRSNELDWEHLAEEIEDVGNSALNAVRSFLRQFLLHLIKAAYSPQQALAPRWGDEAIRFHGDAVDRLTPSMKPLIDIEALWSRAVQGAKASLALYGESFTQAPPVMCPFSLDELTNSSFDVGAAIDRLRLSPDHVALPAERQ